MTTKQKTTISAVTARVSEIRDRAAKDTQFRQDLLTKPSATISTFIGTQVPSDVTIRFVENEGADLTVVLPDFDSNELSDEELEAAAGGCGGLIDRFRDDKRGGPGDTKEPPMQQDNIDKTLI